ncbi:hypothetical protein D3C84_1306000 [compost metagenome]
MKPPFIVAVLGQYRNESLIGQYTGGDCFVQEIHRCIHGIHAAVRACERIGRREAAQIHQIAEAKLHPNAE